MVDRKAGGGRPLLKKLMMDGMRKRCRDLPCKSVAGSTEGEEKEGGERGGRRRVSWGSWSRGALEADCEILRL